MSEIKVNSIKGVGASAAAITVNNSDGTCTANITNNLSNRNLIINGAMQVAQRGTSSTDNGYGTVDRFQVSYGGTDESPTQAQVDVASGTTPYTSGFRKAFRITNGNQTSGAGASDFAIMLYRVEAQDLANSGWNYTSSSSYITLSYWVKSSVAQNFFVTLKSGDGTPQKYATETGSLSADTWTKVTKTISGNSNISFDNDNGEGLEIEWSIFRGTGQTGSMSLNAWAANNNSVRTPDQTSTWYTTNDATLEITGVQLEVGSVATDFEHRSYAEELTLCHRYFYRHITGHPQLINDGFYYLSNYLMSFVTFPVQMRAIPTLSATTGTDYYGFLRNGGLDNFNSFSLHSYTGTRVACLYNNSEISGTVGQSGMVRTGNSAALVDFIAEL